MTTTFGGIRVLLRLAWIVPLVWAFGRGVQNCRSLSPGLPFSWFRTIASRGVATSQKVVSEKRYIGARGSLGLLMAVLAIAVIGLATAISGSQFSFGTGLLNWVVLVAVASFALWTLSETVESLDGAWRLQGRCSCNHCGRGRGACCRSNQGLSGTRRLSGGHCLRAHWVDRHRTRAPVRDRRSRQ